MYEKFVLYNIKYIPLQSKRLFVSTEINVVRQWLRLRFSFKVYVNGIRG